MIPDSFAYSLFFSAVAEPLNPTPEQLRRERAKLSRALLSDADLQALLPILADFQERQKALEASINANATLTSNVDSLRAALVSSVRDEMKTTVTPGGLAKLDALIQVEKRRMTIFPCPKAQ